MAESDAGRSSINALLGGAAALLALIVGAGLILGRTGDGEVATAGDSRTGTTVELPEVASPSSGVPPTAKESSSPAAPSPTSAPATSTTPTTAAPVAIPNGATTDSHVGVYRAGKITLVGRVPAPDDKAFIETKAAQVLGPQNVINKLAVDPAAPPIGTGGRVIVDEPFLFPSASAKIDPANYPLLDLGIAVMKLNPQVTMVVEGHTDSQGDPEANQELSALRAKAAVDYMVTKGGLDRGRFQAEGKGSSEPLVPDDTPEHRQQNRRIEAELLGLLER